MLEKLNEEQVALMEKVKNDWLNVLFSEGRKVDEEKIREGVDWLYSLSNLKKPVTIIVNSPIGAQYAASMLRGVLNTSQVWSQVWSRVRSQVRSQVGSQVESQVESQVGSQVWSQVESQVESQVGSQVRSQVWSQVWSQVRSQVRSQVGSQVESQVGSQVESQVRTENLKYENFASYGNIWDLGWLSFYDFFDQIGIDLGESKTDYKKFADLIKAGVYDMIQLEGVCIVSTLPKVIRRNQQNDLHDRKLPAIEWNDGYKLFYLNGVYFDEALFEQVTSGKMPFEDVLKIEDIDQRKQAMRFVNVWDFVKFANGKELDTYTKTGLDGRQVRYWLFEFPVNNDLFTKGAKYMVYDDSMLGAAAQHMQGVPMEMKTVAEAMSWKQSDDLFTVTPEQWEALQLDVDFT